MAEDSTTRMRVDLSELKKEFKDAQRQIQLVNSEFKAADRKSTRLNSSHVKRSRMPSSA